MNSKTTYDVIIIGGSYAGLSAAMTLGRSLRNVLIIDSGLPCNRQTPHSHNFITQDGRPPALIAGDAKKQVLNYKTVAYIKDEVISVSGKDNDFYLNTEASNCYSARKVLFATGVEDIMPDIAGFPECWGISVLHCPYCHGYEVYDQTIGILVNGKQAFEMAKLIHNWSKDLIIFTNGTLGLTDEQMQKLSLYNIKAVGDTILRIEHTEGYIDDIVFKNGSEYPIKALFARVPFKQRSEIAVNIGCEITEMGLIHVDEFQRTTIPGLFAAGDVTTPLRAVSVAAAGGTTAGAIINKELIDADF